MKWPKHRHWWLSRSHHEMTSDPAKPSYGMIYIEYCRCGAVRTVEIRAGSAPAVRITEAA